MARMQRMYWSHPQLLETEVQTTAIGDCMVSAEPVLFHPDEGGQPSDRGTIGPANVRDVRIIDHRVVHILDRPLDNGRHIARVDAARRRITAGHHTAQHIVSGIAGSHFGLETVGVHIGLEGSTIDFDKRIEWDTAQQLERRAMDVILMDFPVETLFDDGTIQSRSRGDMSERQVIRIVKIGDCDTSACCGAHVQTTGQIGVVRIVDVESKKQGTRISFLAGLQALEFCQSEASVLRGLRQSAHCSTLELPAAFEKAVAQSKELAGELKHLWLLRLAQLAATANVVEVGTSKAAVHVGDVPREHLSRLSNAMADRVGGTGVAVSDRAIAIHAADMDARALLKHIQKHAGGKGGGSTQAANGTLEHAITEATLADILRGFSTGS